MLKWIGLVVVVAVVVVLVLAANRPGTFRVERSARIQAPPEKVQGYIEDFHLWAQWSPFEKLDPAMQRSFSGADKGRGAVYAWEGNGKAGAGRMEILESDPGSRVTIALDFFKPFKASNTAEFTLVPRDGGTEVTWAMFGPVPFVAKIMHLFFDVDSMVGKDFEAGLANLKALAEKG
ncbi:SRPBCC family protein [Pseudomonas sp. BGr12]|uniref:SRPBCC family protein n=1 Tax=Pseudomonas denitrificans TaxID=43306 RepID=A0A9X7R7V1_PSEDE|nr:MULTISPECIES: SRPBCC family protein [Pseudomonadaceae]MBD9574400.1 SRPBCC family protein [Pseudomonas sp. PDM23]MBD9632255.1 SRPBCC family protein [Pseudomonas sp. PDM19]MBD9673222.1 SRPBCC family protein [Pseudomonas sp. PDM21]MDL2425858.1 SRPBCC family protein [Pseudomonas sp. BJa5]QEY75742.1 SRPBCC family protein [Pseudomonas denitrificans (nom. rej.)]